MKVIYLLPVLIAPASSFSLSAQELGYIPASNAAPEKPAKPVKRINICDFNVQTGILLQSEVDGSVDDFKKINPNSSILNSNLEGFQSYSGWSASGNRAFSVQLGLQFSDREKKAYKSNPLLRLGVFYFSATNLSGNLYKETRSDYDTLSSGSTGATILQDSVTTHSYSMSHLAEQIRFDGSLIFRTNPAARWSLYSGIGISAGVTFQTETRILSTYNIRVENHYQDGSTTVASYYFPPEYTYYEKQKTRNGFGGSAYIPMGLDFRIGKKNEFWKQVHLFLEVRPGMNFTAIPELRTVANAYMQSGFGVRVAWD